MTRRNAKHFFLSFSLALGCYVQFNLGNIHKLGRLLGHEWWTVTDKDKKARERYLFLFKSRILVCKVRRISEDRSVFILKDIIKVSCLLQNSIFIHYFMHILCQCHCCCCPLHICKKEKNTPILTHFKMKS